MKILLSILVLSILAACGGSGGTAQQVDVFNQAVGKPLPDQPSSSVPTDPFAPLVKKN